MDPNVFRTPEAFTFGSSLLRNETVTLAIRSQSCSQAQVPAQSRNPNSIVNIPVDTESNLPKSFQYVGPETYVDLMIAAKDLKQQVVQIHNNRADLIKAFENARIANRTKKRRRLRMMNRCLPNMEASLADLEHRATCVKPEDIQLWRDPCKTRKKRNNLEEIQLHVSKLNTLLIDMEDSYSSLTNSLCFGSAQYLCDLERAREQVRRAKNLETTSFMDSEYRMQLGSAGSKLKLAIHSGVAELNAMGVDIESQWRSADRMQTPHMMGAKSNSVGPLLKCHLLRRSKRLLDLRARENDDNAAERQLLQELQVGVAGADEVLHQPSQASDAATDDSDAMSVTFISNGTLEWPGDEIRAAFF